MDILLRLWKYLPELLGAAVGVLAQWQLGRWLLDSRVSRRHTVLKWLFQGATILLGFLVVAGFAFQAPRLSRWLPGAWHWWSAWVRGASIAWAFASAGALILLYLWRRIPNHNPERRALLRVAGGALAAAPFAATGFGIFIQRNALNLTEVDVPVRGLPKDLNGLRLVQLSDIHLSPFLTEAEVARAVAMANETRPHLAIVTGDLITGPRDPLDACLRQLARLRADAGIVGCLGNHEIYAKAEEAATLGGARLGIRFLRKEALQLRFGSATLNLAGVDYQPLDRPYLLGAEKLVRPGAVNILLSHNPDVFPVAAAIGYEVTLSGHTHGGQINVEILDQSLNVARFFTPYVYGLYQQDTAAAYVTRGIGTVGMPARIGAPPEIALIRLCAT